MQSSGRKSCRSFLADVMAAGGSAAGRLLKTVPGSELLGLMVILTATTAFAQSPPDGGGVLREIERSTGQQRPAPAPLAPEKFGPPAEAPVPDREDKTVFVAGFRITGSRFSEQALRDTLAPYISRPLTLAELQQAARSIGEFYRKNDLLAHAYLPPQTIRHGIVEIVVVEGKLGSITVDPSSDTRLDPDLAVGIIAFRVAHGEVVRPSALDEAVAVLNDTPGIKASSSIKAGAREGESDIVLVIEDKPLVQGSVTADNGGSTYTGTWRVLGSAMLDDALGRGDRLSATGLRTSGSRYLRVGASALAGSSGLSVNAFGSGLEYEIGGSLSSLDLKGTAWTAGVGTSYPVRRSSDFSLTLSGSYEHKRFIDRGSDVVLSDKVIDLGTLGLSATTKDDIQGGGTNSLSAVVTAGFVDLSRTRSNFATDQATARNHGLYAKLVLGASREQTVSDTVTVVPSVSAQVTGQNLDSSEKFSLGGIDGVRGYPSGEASGDLGWRLSLETRWQVTDEVQVVGFYDGGGVHQHVDTWPNWEPVPRQPNDLSLHAVGASIAWSPVTMLTFKATMAAAVGGNEGRDLNGNHSDGTNKRLRGWLQVVGSF